MNIEILRHFLSVAELDFQGATDQCLRLEQEQVNAAIHVLEAHLGVKLFECGPHTLRLTLAGRIFRQDAQRLLQFFEQAQLNAQATSTTSHRLLRIALSNVPACDRLIGLLARYRAEEPELDVCLYEVPLSRQLSGLREQRYDLGLSLGHCDQQRTEGLLASTLWRAPLMVVLPQGHSLAGRESIELATALAFPLVLLRTDTCGAEYQQLYQRLDKLGFPSSIMEHASSVDLLLALVVAGHGLGLLHAGHLSPHPHLLARPLASPFPQPATYLMRRDQPPSPILQRFLQLAGLAQGLARP